MLSWRTGLFHGNRWFHTAGAVWAVLVSQLFVMSAVLEAAGFREAGGELWGFFLVPLAADLTIAWELLGVWRCTSQGLRGKLLRFLCC